MGDGARPHVLYVAWGFPPSRSGGVYRALATTNALVGAGFDVTVLTVARETWEHFTGTDPALETLVDPRVEVVRIPFDWPRLETDVRSYSLPRVLWPRAWRRVRSALDQVPFPEVVYGPWRRRLEPAALAVHAGRRVDLVVATANPQVSLTAARALHRRGVPYVVDYRDAWSLDVFSGARVHGALSRVGRWERALFDDAAEIWFVNEPIRTWHAGAYPSAAARMHVVANGFDAPIGDTVGRAAGERPLTFGYLGTVSSKVPLGPFVDGWTLARRRGGPLATARAEVHGYLGFYADAQQALTAAVAAGERAGVSFPGPVSKNGVAGVYAGLDVLLLLLGGGRYVTSGKVYEYLSTGLPIVSVLGPGHAAQDILATYPRWHPAADLSPEAVADALEAAAKDALSSGTAARDAARAAADVYRRERQLAPRLAALHELVAQEVAS